MKKADVFLVLCPLFYTKLPPLSLAYLAEYLETNGIEVKCFDLNIDLYLSKNCEEKRAWNVQNNPKLALSITKNDINGDNPNFNAFISQIKIRNPKIVSFSLFKSSYNPTLECIKMVKKAHNEAKIICGGPEVGHLLSKYGKNNLKNLGIDAIVIGEGEKALASLAKEWPQNDDLIVINNDEIEPLEAIRYPSFSQLDLSKYDVQSMTPLLMSRGCIRQCDFCSERLLYEGYRVRSAGHIISEVEYQMSKGIKSFVFHDSLINGDLKALEEMCDMLIERGLEVSWEAQCVVRKDMPQSLLQRMKRAGCYNLFIGLESASNTVLKKMNKGITTEDVLAFFKKCKEADLHFEISLITNFPGESEAEFEETCKFIVENKELIPKIAQVNPYMPYEGTVTGDGAPIIDEALGYDKMKRLVSLFEREGILYTKSYIGNLLPQGSYNAL